MTVAMESSVRITVANDGLRVWLSSADTSSDLPSNPNPVLDALRELHVRVDEGVIERIGRALENLARCRTAGHFHLIALGEPPTEPTDGFVVFQGGCPDGAPGSYFQRVVQDSACLARRNDVIGRIVPPTAAHPGRDVYGRSAAPRRASGEPVHLSKSVRLAGDGESLIAARPGRCDFNRGVASVNELTLVERDIRPSVEKLDWINDVVIRGDVRDAANLRSAQSLVVVGAVKDASARAARCVIVHCGLIGSGKGKIEAGDDVAAKFCEDASVIAGRDVIIGASAMNSTLCAARDIRAEAASIVGGKLSAGRLIHLGQLGSDRSTSTRVVIQPTSKDAESRLIVEQNIRAGTILEFGPLRSVFKEDLRGPVSIEPRWADGVTSLLCTPRDGHEMRELPSTPIECAPA